MFLEHLRSRWFVKWFRHSVAPWGALAADVSVHVSSDARGSRCSPQLSERGSAPPFCKAHVCAAPAEPHT